LLAVEAWLAVEAFAALAVALGLGPRALLIASG
jgi:hypothetical protein